MCDGHSQLPSKKDLVAIPEVVTDNRNSMSMERRTQANLEFQMDDLNHRQH